MDERALQLASIWVDLDRYEKLNGEIESRLMILNPLIEQLEKVASAGVGDVTQVAAAQRTVSAIRVTQTDVAERLAQTQVSFVNAFGSLPARGSFEGGFVANKVPAKISDEMERAAPALLALGRLSTIVKTKTGGAFPPPDWSSLKYNGLRSSPCRHSRAMLCP